MAKEQDELNKKGAVREEKDQSDSDEPEENDQPDSDVPLTELLEESMEPEAEVSANV